MTGFALFAVAVVLQVLALFLAAVFGRSIAEKDAHEGAQCLVFWASVFLATIGLLLALCA